MSRLFYIAKNYLKLILRSKAMIIITVLGTIMVVAALSSTFRTILNEAEKDTDFTIGYHMEEGSRYSIAEDLLVDGFEEEGLTVIKYKDEDPEELIKNGDVVVFIDFGKDSYSLTGDKQKQIDTRIIQYVLYNVDSAMNGEFGTVKVEPEELETVETPSAEDYYGIVQTVYFISLCAVFLTPIFINERKGNIAMRFKVSSATGTHSYLGKITSCVLVSWAAQTVLATGALVLLLGVHIGVPPVSIALLMLATAAFCAFGTLFFIIFKNPAVSIGLLFGILWFAGLVGGTFETYMYSSFSESIKRLSPYYFLNRSLVELTTSGSSEYLLPCIAEMVIILAVSMALGILITNKKKEV
ncbi:MAG: ABC transporter permease [Clostridiales bacterium]|nr:ABC transporter permease [Clostridiales bacterium]